MEAVILAGGFGTRLKTVLQDIPKSMAPIQGKPFLEYVLLHLSRFNISNVILCTGFRHEAIQNYFGSSFEEISISYSQEKEPLGTGGALLKALEGVKDQHCLALNGDSFFKAPIDDLIKAHFEYDSDFTIALKKMTDFDRYGTAKLEGSRIIAFEEKRFRKEGVINGGVYCVRKSAMTNLGLPDKFSLEKDFFEKYVSTVRMHGKVFDGYFIDIGIPEDFCRAQLGLPAFK